MDVSLTSRQGFPILVVALIYRAGTVTGPLSVHYYSGKAALIRAVGCVQAELDLQGFQDIHLYALHPGGCKTGLQSHHLLRRRSLNP
jgi:hypothetical protein